MIFILSFIEIKYRKADQNQQTGNKKSANEMQPIFRKSNYSSSVFKKLEYKMTAIKNDTVVKKRYRPKNSNFTNNNSNKLLCGKCHELAKCTYPGKCECPPGYEGDGTTLCYIPPPESFSYELGQFPGNSTKYINVSYTGVSTKINITKIYCKVGTQISPAISFNRLYALCNATYTTNGVEIYLSFDGKSFGLGVMIDNSPFHYYFIFLCMFCVFMLVTYIIFLLFITPSFANKYSPIAQEDIHLNSYFNKVKDIL